MSWDDLPTYAETVETRSGLLATRTNGDPALPPLVLCQRFRGTMDDWDPAFIERLTAGRRVIRFDSAGIGESQGETPNTVAGMAEVLSNLLEALELDQVDLLGWSLGGYVAQTLALDQPDKVWRLVIAGSGPGGLDGPPPHPRVAEIAAKPSASPDEVAFLFFTQSGAGRAAAEQHFARIRLGERQPVDVGSGRRQREAIVAWWRGEGAARPHLPQLSMPILVANGIGDVMVPAEHSFAIARGAPEAKLVLYPDAGHTFLFQCAEDFTAEVMRFLGP